MRFRTTVLLGGKTATGLTVPPEVVDALGKGKRPPVKVTINRHTYRSTVAVMGGQFMIPLAAEHRAAAGVAAGDEVDADIELDTESREIQLPRDFADALAPYPEARAFFDSLSNSRKQWFVLSVEGAKQPETRRRRIEQAVAMLREGRRPA